MCLVRLQGRPPRCNQFVVFWVHPASRHAFSHVEIVEIHHRLTSRFAGHSPVFPRTCQTKREDDARPPVARFPQLSRRVRHLRCPDMIGRVASVPRRPSEDGTVEWRSSPRARLRGSSGEGNLEGGRDACWPLCAVNAQSLIQGPTNDDAPTTQQVIQPGGRRPLHHGADPDV
jgi:hypothetical protein